MRRHGGNRPRPPRRPGLRRPPAPRDRRDPSPPSPHATGRARRDAASARRITARPPTDPDRHRRTRAVRLRRRRRESSGSPPRSTRHSPAGGHGRRARTRPCGSRRTRPQWHDEAACGPGRAACRATRRRRARWRLRSLEFVEAHRAARTRAPDQSRAACSATTSASTSCGRRASSSSRPTAAPTTTVRPTGRGTSSVTGGSSAAAGPCSASAGTTSGHRPTSVRAILDQALDDRSLTRIRHAIR